MAVNELSVMIGAVISRIDCTDDSDGDQIDCGEGNRMSFHAVDGREFVFYHHQDWCESVRINDICGDLADLVGTPILQAESVTNEDEPRPEGAESFTWTFYKFATVKGAVTVRWLGESSGYYSESVDFAVVAPASDASSPDRGES